MLPRGLRTSAACKKWVASEKVRFKELRAVSTYWWKRGGFKFYDYQLFVSYLRYMEHRFRGIAIYSVREAWFLFNCYSNYSLSSSIAVLANVKKGQMKWFVFFAFVTVILLNRIMTARVFLHLPHLDHIDLPFLDFVSVHHKFLPTKILLARSIWWELEFIYIVGCF